jgi:hypothetical protein
LADFSQLDYSGGLRRYVSVLLLAFFSLTLIGPLFAAKPDANLPACCRRAGTHRCAMSGGATHRAPGFQADQRCPLYPGILVPPVRSLAIAVAHPFSSSISFPALEFLAVCQHTRPNSVLNSAHESRGPPAQSSPIS